MRAAAMAIDRCSRRRLCALAGAGDLGGGLGTSVLVVVMVFGGEPSAQF